MKYTVQLTAAEQKEAKDRAAEAIQRGKSCRQDFTMGNEPRMKVLGAGGEIALSVLVGTPIKALKFEGRDDGDIGGIEVRTTEYKASWLVINARDLKKLERPFVVGLHLGKGLYEFTGWHFGWFVRKHGKPLQAKATNSRSQSVTQSMFYLTREQQRPMDELILLANKYPPERAVRDYTALLMLKQG